MIAHIEWILESKSPTSVVIDVNGIGYLLNISLNTYDQLPSKGKLRLYSHLIVREDAHILFGFSEEEERLMFKELINVSGVGASTALMILSSISSFILIKENDLIVSLEILSFPIIFIFFTTSASVKLEIKRNTKITDKKSFI